ncbi:MAG: hypothetical protein E2604_03165 [Flavobacterium sp.]|uniref:Uncharacterized protein n=1 Tax=Flavobacterium supellecticarium TaxID=2565924 RepID=A0A4S4A0M7_9FLAO|nr:hypothetical protein [Flavobacterium supellecticarium]MPT34098.1 hypothetical protein [Flavobacterium sp.]THF51818.1 hypothetical protein E6C50_08665 [Flavobacterium supellecticarium]
MFEIFSTREVAIIIWSSIFIVGALIILKFKGILPLLKSFFNYKIQTLLWSTFIYIAVVTICLYYLRTWDLTLLKDTIIWSITSATILLFNISKVKDFTYFKPMVLENLKATVVFEFITNFYTFSFTTEMIVIPIMTFIGVLQIFAEHSSKTNSEHLKVASCLKRFLSITGILIFIYVSYKTYKYYDQLLTIQNIKSLLLPFVYTLFLIPFLYFVALYMSYEMLLIRIPYLLKKEKRRKKLKKNIFLFAKLNLNKLHKISTGLNWYSIEKHGIKKSLRKIIK